MLNKDTLRSTFIDNKWLLGSSRQVIENINPYNNKIISSIQAANMNDVDAAYASAQSAFVIWSESQPEIRSAFILNIKEVIERRREEIIDLLIQETGSTRLKANIEVDAALSMVAAASDYPYRVKDSVLTSPVDGQKSHVYRKPLGVIGVISPWNFPFHLSLRSVIPAIAVGNTVVVKPSSDSPITGGLLLADIFQEAGAIPGILNVVVGTGKEIGDYFVQHNVPRFISFTGSTAVGKRVGQLAISAPLLKRVALELGGNAPLVVLDDADLDLAASIAAFGRFLHQGQICMSTNRVIVDAKVHDAFVNKLINKVKTIPYGDPDETTTIVGPIINKNQIKNIKQLIEQGIAQGAELVLGGEIKNNVIPPHVFINVDPESALAKEESFGPVLPIIKANDEAHALVLANNSEYGLSSSVCTQNLERGKDFALKLDVGMTHINDITIEDQPGAPFGGEKNSGLGRFNDQWIIDEFTRTHWITCQTESKTYLV
ncbi:aldehyde dehydrogenase family protein [Acinetobacter chengduensis]|uniref:Aldehyde dehydrogenase family protein n=1 Tax=Acinetobacter chengduensis TaxID=2420890 RepID=A0ABX9TVP8_9GAMM|nr:aldehyde dehydrogenase family protein [Acinetobacter chengduensis]RLL21818.1 aldehyde dehydrogenase family protein [Acinetobacter chengduensis]